MHSKEKEMDLFNNTVGRNVGITNNENLRQLILDKLNNGELRYLSSLTSNCLASHESLLINTNQ